MPIATIAGSGGVAGAGITLGSRHQFTQDSAFLDRMRVSTPPAQGHELLLQRLETRQPGAYALDLLVDQLIDVAAIRRDAGGEVQEPAHVRQRDIEGATVLDSSKQDESDFQRLGNPLRFYPVGLCSRGRSGHLSM